MFSATSWVSRVSFGARPAVAWINFRLNIDKFIVWRKCRQRDTTDDDIEETLHSENDTELELIVLFSAPQSTSIPSTSSTPIAFFTVATKEAALHSAIAATALYFKSSAATSVSIMVSTINITCVLSEFFVVIYYFYVHIISESCCNKVATYNVWCYWYIINSYISKFKLFSHYIWKKKIQKTNLTKLLKYRIHETNRLDGLEYLHRNVLKTTKEHVRVPTGFLEASRMFLNTEANISWLLVCAAGIHYRNTWKLLLNLI